MRHLLYGFLTLAAAQLCAAQQAQTSSIRYIPAFSIEPVAETGKPLPLNPIIGPPPFCVADNLWLEEIKPDGKHVLTRTDLDGNQVEFEAARQTQVRIPEEIDTLQRADVTAEVVVLFVNGFDEKDVVIKTVTNADGSPGKVEAPSGPLRTFGLVFDQQGKYQEKVTIPERFNLHAAARFPSGDYLIIGVDTLNEVPIVEIISPLGTLRQIVQLPNPLALSTAQVDQMSQKRDSGPLAKIQKLGWALDLMQTVHYGDRILLVQPGSSQPILNIGPHADVTEIKPRVPISWPLDSAFVSDGSVFLRYSSSANGAGASRIYQIETLKGTAIREFNVGKAKAWEVSCIKKDKVLMITSMDFQKHTFTFGEGRLLVDQPSTSPQN